MAPNQRPTIAALGLKSVLGGLLATLMNAAVAGALWSFVH
jgi:nucleoside permease NupC